MKTLFGGILLAIGILIAGASGLCSLMMLVSIGSDPGSMGEMLLIVLFVGGIPFVIGIGMIFGGLALIRAGRREDGSG